MAAVTWSVKVVPGQTSQAVPAVAALGRELRMVYLGASGNHIHHAVFAGGKWTAKGRVKDKQTEDEQTSQAVPALAALGSQLHMVYLGENDNRIRHAVLRGGHWTAKGRVKDKQSQDEQTSHAVPALAALGGQLHMVFLGDSQRIHHAIGTIASP
jgi:hypothetical protein